MILFLDTTDHNKAKLALIDDERVIVHEFETDHKLSESLPGKIEQFLAKNKKNIDDIEKVAVVRGPGSFVGSRTGTAFANVFAWSRQIPALGLEIHEVPRDLTKLNKMKFERKVITPAYGNPANITKSK